MLINLNAISCCCDEFSVVPIDDVLTTNWEDSTGGNGDGDMWDELDDWPDPSGISYCRTTTDGARLRIKLADATGFTNGSAASSYKFMCYARFSPVSLGGAITLELYDGATLIRSAPLFALQVADTWHLGEVTLTQEEYDNITDFFDLRLDIRGDAVTTFDYLETSSQRYSEEC